MEHENALKFYLDAIQFSHGPSLELMAELCRRLGDPQKKLPCIHIAGTNGKGSCAAMLSSIFRAAGKKTGLFTSPHLVDFGERIQINGVYITPEEIAALTPRIAKAARDLPPLSFFELVTALAFLHFAQKECDMVVLECGLGGRYDATNLIPSPLCSVLMPIGLDHTAVLGGSLAAIAGEKAGILKPGCPAVCAPQSPEAMEVISRTAEELNCPLKVVDIKSLSVQRHNLHGQQFHYKNMRNVHLSLLGPHQAKNAAAAIECARLLGLDDGVIRRGLSNTVWPCRFEPVEKDPPFLLDAAHNPHGAEALVKGLESYFPGEKFCFILGVMADKDWPGLLPLLEPVAEKFLCIAPDNPRALPAKELADRIRNVPAEACDSLEAALNRARESGRPVCACGSLYFIGHLRKLLKTGLPE